MTYNEHLNSAAAHWQRKTRMEAEWAMRYFRTGNIKRAVFHQHESARYARQARQYLFELIEREKT